MKMFNMEDSIADLTQHIHPVNVRLIRYYGLFSSRSRWPTPDLLSPSVHVHPCASEMTGVGACYKKFSGRLEREA